MKRSAWILAIGLLLGLLAYGVAFFVQSKSICVWAKNENNELKWLREEFHLSDQQIEKITALHKAYRPRCEIMCQKIIASNDHLGALIRANQQMTPEMQAALKENTDLQNECRQAMLEHIYSVSREMPPEQGHRYIDFMKKSVLQPGQSSSLAQSR